MEPMRAEQYACPDCDQPFGQHALDASGAVLLCPWEADWHLPVWDGTQPDHQWHDTDAGRLRRRVRWDRNWPK